MNSGFSESFLGTSTGPVWSGLESHRLILLA